MTSSVEIVWLLLKLLAIIFYQMIEDRCFDVRMQKLPGGAGWPLLSDKSYEFYKDPLKFLMKNTAKHNSRIFEARFLNKPTAFVGSCNGAREVLEDAGECLEFGYKAFMEEIYGNNVLFTDGEVAFQLRESLGQLFTNNSIQSYFPTIERIITNAFDKLQTGTPVCIYSFFKRISTELCLGLFLGLDFQEAEEISERIISLTTEHWHGIISVPLAIKLPLPGLEASTYKKALDAKEKLLNIIKEKRAINTEIFTQKMEKCFKNSDLEVNNHLLLFTSALAPKAIASILTSFIIRTPVDYLNGSEYSEEKVKHILLEVLRLYPPFLGGRRIVKKECSIDGYHIPSGHAIVYVTVMAHRDPSCYENAETFDPDRWKKSEDNKNLFSFGFGRRCCQGQTLVKVMLETILKKLMDSYTWNVKEDQNLTQKWLPVSRPRESIQVQFDKK